MLFFREPEQVAPQPCPEPHRAHSSAAGMMNGSLKSLGRLGSLGSSPSWGSPTSYHIRNSSSASSLSLAPEAIPVTQRKDMKFVPCVASSR